VTSTLPPEVSDREARRARALRRTGLGLLAVFVAAGLLGLLGTRTTETSGSADGYEVTVTHPAVSRAGHAVRVEVEVRRPGGFDDVVRLRLRSAYFDLFDENAFTPAPEAETADGEWTYQEFAPPPGDVLVVSVDTRVEPARNRGERGAVEVLDEDGRTVLAVAFRTRLVP
jgi:hypothetical protein